MLKNRKEKYQDSSYAGIFKHKGKKEVSFAQGHPLFRNSGLECQVLQGKSTVDGERLMLEGREDKNFLQNVLRFHRISKQEENTDYQHLLSFYFEINFHHMITFPPLIIYYKSA